MFLALRFPFLTLRWCFVGLVLWISFLAWGAQPAEITTASQRPIKGGVLRLAFPTDWRSLDPAIGFDIQGVPLQRLLFTTLVDYNEGNDLVPSDAESWSVSEDLKTYTFHLRPGIRFAHGREVEAADYVFSLERVLTPSTTSPGSTYFFGIRGAQDFWKGSTNHVAGLVAMGSKTLKIELEKPDFTFRYVMAMPMAAVLPRELVVESPEIFKRRPIGSGPYQIQEWKRNVSYSFIRNPHYSGSAPAYIDGFRIMIGGDQTLFAMMFERNELDFVMDPTSADLVRLMRDPQKRQWADQVPMAGTDYLAMNTELRPFSDVRVRRAVNYAIQKPRLAKLAGVGFRVANTILPPTMPGFNAHAPESEYAPDKARQLLTEAGYPNGFETELWYSTSLPQWVRANQAIQQDLERVGIRVVLKPSITAAFETTVRTRGRVPMAYWGWVQDYPDPSNFLEVLLNGERIVEKDCNNIAFYNNPEVNALLSRAAVMTDLLKRQVLFQEAEKRILVDAPWVPTMYTTQSILRHPRVRGFKPHPVWLYRYENLWLDPKEPPIHP